MRYLALASLCLAAPSMLAQEQSPITPLTSTASFDRFQQAQGGDWIVKWHPATGTPSTIYGTGLKIRGWGKNSLQEGRRHANRLLVDQAELLGLGTSTFREIIGARMGRTWSFTFDQFFKGIPVIEGRVDVRVNMAGVIAMMGSRAWPIPANFNTVPAIGANLAQAAAWTSLGSEPVGNAPAPRLVIWGDIDSARIAPFFLAWEVTVHDIAGGTFGRYYIDARTGRELHFQNDKHDGVSSAYQPTVEASAVEEAVTAPSVTLTEVPREDAIDAPTITTVTLMAWTRTGNDATSALQNVPLRNVILNVPGIGNMTTDANGQFDIDITSPVTISVNGLNGTHHAPITGANQPTGSVTVNPGVNATIQLLTSSASTNQAAHTTASYWTDRSNVWARGILGNTSQMNTASGIGVAVNITSTCNAYYTNNTTNFYQAGGGCSNTAFSSVVAHEWGHGLDARYGGISNSNAEGLSEGWGDIIGMYQTDSPLLGLGFQSPGVALRNGNNSRIWPYSSSSPHGAGQVWMGWAWRFREALRASLGTTAAVILSDDLVLSSIVADATTRQNAVLEVFIADDDDGNLLNGTPHYAELQSASIQKGIPYPEVEDLVAFGQGCPSSIPTPAPTCPQVNASGGTLSNTLRDNDYCYLVNNSGNYEVTSFTIFSGTTTSGNVTVPAHIYLDNNGVPQANPVASTTIVVGSTPAFYTATFSQPVPVSGTYYLGFDTSSDNVYLSTLTSGASGVGFWRDPANGTPNWTQSGLIQRPSWVVSCQNASNFLIASIGLVGAPELGTTYLPQVTNAPPSSIALLASGLSDQIYQGLPLPIAIPGASGCDLLVSADILTATTTSAAGTASLPILVPNQPSLAGLEVFHQWVLGDLPANSLGFVVSDGGVVVIRL